MMITLIPIMLWVRIKEMNEKNYLYVKENNELLDTLFSCNRLDIEVEQKYHAFCNNFKTLQCWRKWNKKKYRGNGGKTIYKLG